MSNVLTNWKIRLYPFFLTQKHITLSLFSSPSQFSLATHHHHDANIPQPQRLLASQVSSHSTSRPRPHSRLNQVQHDTTTPLDQKLLCTKSYMCTIMQKAYLYVCVPLWKYTLSLPMFAKSLPSICKIYIKMKQMY